MDLFKLVGKVAVDTSTTDKNLQASSQGAQDVSTQVSKLGTVAAGVVAAVSAAAVAAGKAMFDMVSDTSSRLDNIAKKARNMSVGTDWYQEWAYIAEQSNVDMSTIAKAVETMTQKVGDGSDATDLALQQLGISLEDAQSMAPADLFELIRDRLGEIEDPATRASIASDLLGGSWKNLGVIFDLTSEQLDGLKQTAHDLGVVVSEDDLVKGEAFQDAMTNWQTAVTGLKDAIAIQLLPSLTSVVNWATGTLVPTVNNIFSFLTAPVSEIFSIEATAEGGGVQADIHHSAQGYKINYEDPDGLYLDTSTGIGPTRWAEYEEAHGYASGLDYVPYDEYPARLHTGEAVLTAEEAESWRASQSGQPLYIVQNIEAKPQNAAELAAVTTAAISRARWSKS